MRRQKLSGSSNSGNSDDAAFHLEFDWGFAYAGSFGDSRPLPRLPLYIARVGDIEAAAPIGLAPVLDSGAEHTAFDGAVMQYLGWAEQDIAGRATGVLPISGLQAHGQPLVGYLHDLTCLIPLGRQYASLQLRVLITPPNTLVTPVLGRHDFFRQVDFALLEADQRFYLRFRNRSVLSDTW